MLVHTIQFKVKGVTSKNEENRDIQEEIKKILKEYKTNNYFLEYYGGYTNAEIKENDLNVSEYEGEKFSAKLVGDEYNNKPCFKVYFQTYNNEFVHVGYAEKDKIEEISEWILKEGLKIDGSIEVIGGKYKHAEIYTEDYEEKERIVTEEFTYGLEVVLNFYDEKKQNENNNIINNNKINKPKKRNKFLIGLLIFLLLALISNIIRIFN